MNENSHVSGEPPILYFGTPVVLISSENENGTANLAPMSSAFWLGWRCIIGLETVSKTTENIKRSGECVLNLPSAALVQCVDRLALTTGADPVPSSKSLRGYRTERYKFERAGLTPIPGETVAAPRALECPVQMEARLEHWRPLAESDEMLRGAVTLYELRIQRVHLARSILKDGNPDRVDPDKWRPLIMSFAKFYGLKDVQLTKSTLAKIPEAVYRSPDIERARNTARVALSNVSDGRE